MTADQPPPAEPPPAEPPPAEPPPAEPPPAEPPRARPPSGNKPAPKPDRLAREAAALRANLRKRKDQARLRADASGPPKQT